MHENSLRLMKELLASYGRGKSLLDVGSQDINGTYRELAVTLGYAYTGLDIVPGVNVDIVAEDNWPDVLYDIVISGQCLEHVCRPWEWIRKVAASVATGGTVIIIAPWTWEIHPFPVDCWRILPDGMKALMEYADLRLITTGIDQADCYGVARR